MIRFWWHSILGLWKANGGSAWDPMPTLAHHLLHVCGGAAVVLVGMAFGLHWWNAALASTCLFLAIEMATAFAKDNWRDSIFDFFQYNMHWLLYFVWRGRWWLAGIGVIVWMALYFYQLVKRG